MLRSAETSGPVISTCWVEESRLASSLVALPPAARGRLMTDLQETAFRWFAGLRNDYDAGGRARAAARTQLEAIRAELNDDEFAILSELCRPSAWINYRVGRSRHTVRELEMSALRKLVIYRTTNGLD
jgi:hypothetical protein